MEKEDGSNDAEERKEKRKGYKKQEREEKQGHRRRGTKAKTASGAVMRIVY
jgi:hypothetical protein